MRIDLHTHSTYSDGTDTPAELMYRAAQAGVDVLALTDHDTIAGWGEAAQAVATTGVSLVRGIELTTREGKKLIHLLGYLFNPASAEISAHCAKLFTARRERVTEMVERLAKDYPISLAAIVERVGENVPLGRPHIADELVRLSVVKNRQQAFAGLLHHKSPYYVPNYAPSTFQALQWIKEAGGQAVLAHPFATKRGGVVPEYLMRELAEAGLFGVEVDHRENDSALIEPLRKLALEIDLVTFGSSDFHGRGKPNILGENTTSPEGLEKLVATSFLEVVTA